MWPVKKKIGYLLGEQLQINGQNILSRVPVYTDSFNEEEHYDVWKEGMYFITIISPRYVLKSTKRHYELELDPAEYSQIKRLIKINDHIKKKKINHDDHQRLIERFKRKLK